METIISFIISNPIDSVLVGIIYGVSIPMSFNLEKEFWIEKGSPCGKFGFAFVVIDSLLPVINTVLALAYSVKRIAKNRLSY
jgi:hypothetical protein